MGSSSQPDQALSCPSWILERVEVLKRVRKGLCMAEILTVERSTLLLRNPQTTFMVRVKVGLAEYEHDFDRGCVQRSDF